MSAVATIQRDGAPVLELRGIGKEFGAIRALSDVDLTIAPGEVVGLMGDNGAGKSTLVKIIAGNFHPDPRHDPARRDGAPVRPAARRARRRHRGRLPGSRAGRQRQRRRQCVPRPRAHPQGRPVLVSRPHGHERAGAGAVRRAEVRDAAPRPRASSMSGGQRQAVAIARTRLAKAKLILMDEPTAAISVRQVAEVLDLIRRLRDGGVAVDPDLAPHARRLLASATGSWCCGAARSAPTSRCRNRAPRRSRP